MEEDFFMKITVEEFLWGRYVINYISEHLIKTSILLPDEYIICCSLRYIQLIDILIQILEEYEITLPIDAYIGLFKTVFVS